MTLSEVSFTGLGSLVLRIAFRIGCGRQQRVSPLVSGIAGILLLAGCLRIGGIVREGLDGAARRRVLSAPGCGAWSAARGWRSRRPALRRAGSSACSTRTRPAAVRGLVKARVKPVSAAFLRQIAVTPAEVSRTEEILLDHLGAEFRILRHRIRHRIDQLGRRILRRARPPSPASEDRSAGSGSRLRDGDRSASRGLRAPDHW